MYTVTRTLKYTAQHQKDLEYQLGLCFIRPDSPLIRSDGLNPVRIVFSIEEIARTEITEEADVRKDL